MRLTAQPKSRQWSYLLSAGALVMAGSLFVMRSFATVPDFLTGLGMGVGIGLLFLALLVARK
jgi:hypothetical protein